MSTLPALKWRHSLKHFSSQKVSKAYLDDLTEAARLSVSAYGLQPYQVWVIANPTLLKQLAQYASDQPQLHECSHLIVFAHQTKIGDALVDQYFQHYYEQTGVEVGSLDGYSDHIKSAIAAKSHQERQNWAQQQVYIALGALLTEAAIQGIDTCPMTGFDVDAFNQLLGFDNQNLNACVICAVGYRKDTLEIAPKVRMPSQDFVQFVA